MKTKIFTTFIPDGDGYPSVFRIGLTPNAFPKEKEEGAYGKESMIYFQELDPDVEVTNPDDECWKPWSGKTESEYGYVDSNNTFYDIDTEEEIEEYLGSMEYNKIKGSLQEAKRIEIYESGHLVETKIIRI